MTSGRKLVGTSRNDEIETPDDLYYWLDCRFHFDYDAFASHSNFKTAKHCSGMKTYSTIEGTFVVDVTPRAERLVVAEDGLAHDWYGKRVFCNPPYSRGLLSKAIDKMVAERNRAQIIVALVKVDTSTAWWRKLAMYSHVEYLPRVKYVTPDGGDSPATFASAVCIIKPDITDWRK